ncbi:chemotaxis protein CheW [Noviherbaspirillum galbum]|uniref:Chemotaxis protein CheW n=1 Tax=Noviherbaspirillum galbum TaxID=2709383 RepID=A0A6B3SI78_9BURK|nr:chemotaxis protein CheW [Noviherbaspirillum galbum]NEX60554.1 chemotaxis protein CheW [Noviherbaspirillum galbum]
MSAPTPTGIDACWNRIGVRGDRSCERLAGHGHCQHCEVYPEAAGRIMQRPLPAGYQAEWTAHFAQPEEARQVLDQAVLAFRLADEWYALPAKQIVMVADPARPHGIPHRRRPELLGIVNLRGKLYPCVSLAAILGIADQDSAATGGERVFPRMLVLQQGAAAYAIPVQEAHGIVRYHAGMLESLPSTASATARDYLLGMLEDGPRRIACLDAGRLAPVLAGVLK